MTLQPDSIPNPTSNLAGLFMRPSPLGRSGSITTTDKTLAIWFILIAAEILQGNDTSEESTSSLK